jgi:hypothetical protein
MSFQSDVITNERRRKLLACLESTLQENAAAEARRRQAWVEEEKERRNRMQEQLQREKGDALRDPVRQHAEENKEQLQHQLLSAFSVVTTHQAEERERLERMYVDAKADLEGWLRSKLDLVETKVAEEIERARRVKEGINTELSGTLSLARFHDVTLLCAVLLTFSLGAQRPTRECRPSS